METRKDKHPVHTQNVGYIVLLEFTVMKFLLTLFCFSIVLPLENLKIMTKGTRCLGSGELVYEKHLKPFVMKCMV